MNSLSLEWDTFDFYTMKIQEQESIHESKLSLIKSFLGKNYKFSQTKKADLLSDYNKCCKHLLLLYRKQLDSLENLIKLNKDLVDIPPEREVSSQTLSELKNVTATLIRQVTQHQEDMKSLFDSEEGFDFEA